jgi:hypothetical protein
MEKQKEYQQNYDKDWNKPGRRYFVVFNIEDNKKIFYIHDVQDGKVYRNYNNDDDRFHDADESYSNFNLTDENNEIRISRLLTEKGIKFNFEELDEIMDRNEMFKQNWINYNNNNKIDIIVSIKLHIILKYYHGK